MAGVGVQRLTRVPWKAQQTPLQLRLVLSASLAACSLLVAGPVFGQSNSTLAPQPALDPTRETVEQTPVPHTALFNPELDGMLANALLWTIYLSLPIGMVVAIRCYDRHTHQQMAKLAEQIATLERIWQKTQTH
jgi:hypothetical protein